MQGLLLGWSSSLPAHHVPTPPPMPPSPAVPCRSGCPWPLGMPAGPGCSPCQQPHLQAGWPAGAVGAGPQQSACEVRAWRGQLRCRALHVYLEINHGCAGTRKLTMVEAGGKLGLPASCHHVHCAVVPTWLAVSCDAALVWSQASWLDCLADSRLSWARPDTCRQQALGHHAQCLCCGVRWQDWTHACGWTACMKEFLCSMLQGGLA